MSETIKVLLVDDNPLDRELIRESLVIEHTGFTLTEASSKPELEKILETCPIDIVLTDYNILQYNGLEITDYISANFPELPIIMVTGTGSEEIAVEAMKKGIADYVLKTNSHIRRLPITIERALEFHKLRQDQKVAARRETAAKESWERMFNAISDPLLLLNADLTIKQANRAAYELSTPQEGVIGRHCYNLFGVTGDYCAGCTLRPSAFPSNSLSIERNCVLLGKSFQTSAYPILNGENTIAEIVLYAKDVTEQKILAEQLFQAHKMEAIGTLAGGIAHDFNNLLSAILGYTSLTKLGLAKGEDVNDNLDVIIKAVNRASELVKQILTFSRKTEVNQQQLQPHLIVKEASKMLRSTLPTTITVQEDIDTNCGEILADPTHLYQIVVNLCTNAYHSMENEKGTLSIGLSFEEVEKSDLVEPDAVAGPYVVLSIGDTGVGISEAIKEHIFEPFFTTKEVGKGTGMGLSIIYGIVKESNGFIRVNSEANQGSIFQVYLPALKDTKELPTATTKDEPLYTGTERIIIVDDDESIATLHEMLFKHLGYTVTRFTDSVQALESFRAAPDHFDLLFTDQTMPSISGAELAQEVLKIKPNFPIILTTGYSAVISEEKALSMGIKKMVNKPVDFSEIAKIFRQLLDEK